MYASIPPPPRIYAHEQSHFEKFTFTLNTLNLNLQKNKVPTKSNPFALAFNRDGFENSPQKCNNFSECSSETARHNACPKGNPLNFHHLLLRFVPTKLNCISVFCILKKIPPKCNKFSECSSETARHNACPKGKYQESTCNIMNIE